MTIDSGDKHFISDNRLNKFIFDVKNDSASGVILWENIRAKYSWTEYINSLNAICHELAIEPDETIDYIVNATNEYKNTMINRHIHALERIKAY